MVGRAEALTVMSQTLEAALDGRTDDAADRYREALEWFDRDGGQYDHDLEQAVVQVGHRIHRIHAIQAQEWPTVAVPDRSADVAQAVGEAGVCPTCDGDGAIFAPGWREWHNQVDEARHAWRADHPTGLWEDTDDARALLDAEPDGAEEYQCADCEGTGRAASPADVPLGDVDRERARLIAEALTGNTEPLRDSAHTEVEVGPIDTEPPDAADSGDCAVGEDSLSPVDQAQRAVLELKGRRALEEQYAQARTPDDDAVDRHSEVADAEGVEEQTHVLAGCRSGVGGRDARPPPPASRGSRLPDVGAHCVRLSPRPPDQEHHLTPEPRAARQEPRRAWPGPPDRRRTARVPHPRHTHPSHSAAALFGRNRH